MCSKGLLLFLFEFVRREINFSLNKTSPTSSLFYLTKTSPSIRQLIKSQIINDVKYQSKYRKRKCLIMMLQGLNLLSKLYSCIFYLIKI